MTTFTPRSPDGPAGSSENGLLASAASPKGRVIAVGNTEGSILLLDCSRSQLSEREYLSVPPSHSGAVGKAHASRVFTIRWHPDDPNVLLSGGWDKFLKVRGVNDRWISDSCAFF